MNKKAHKPEQVETSVAQQPEQSATKVAAPQQTEADKIWSEIKDRKLAMFALNNAKVSDYCRPEKVMPMKCFLVAKASSVLPALEEALGATFVCEAMNKYIVVSRKV